MFLKNGLNGAKTGTIPDIPEKLQEGLDDVLFSHFALLGSCYPAPPHGRAGHIFGDTCVTRYRHWVRGSGHQAAADSNVLELADDKEVKREFTHGGNPISVALYCCQVGNRAGDFRHSYILKRSQKSRLLHAIS